MTCPRHGIIARFEQSLCAYCFREAVAVAEAKALEDKIRDLRSTSALVNVRWVRIRSWHIVLTPTRAINTYRTLCGRNALGPDTDDRPGSERTCESCLRIGGPK